MKKKVAPLLICLLILFICIAPAQAGGIPVIDISHIMQSVMNYYQLVSQYKKMVEEFEFLKKALENPEQLTNRMIASQIFKIANLHENMKGMVFDYTKIQEAWDKNYKDFSGFNGMSASDYAKHANKTLEATNNAIFDAMKAQGLVVELESDTKLLQDLLDQSAKADGAIKAAQVGHYIASLEITQLMRMQEIMAASYRAQCSYYQHLLQNEQMAKVQNEKLLINEPNPLSTLLGIGPGFGF